MKTIAVVGVVVCVLVLVFSLTVNELSEDQTQSPQMEQNSELTDTQANHG